MRACTREELEAARALLARAKEERIPFLEIVEANTILKLARRDYTQLPGEVQVFRITEDVAIVGLPGEIFAELGLGIKQASPFRYTFVIELANDAPAYIPTEKAFSEGSYETVNCLIKPGGGEKLAAAADTLLSEMGK